MSGKNTPIPWVYKEDRTQRGPTFEGDSPYGTVRFKLPNDEEIEVEAYVRAGNEIGLLVRGITCSLELQCDASNTVIVKARRR